VPAGRRLRALRVIVDEVLEVLLTQLEGTGAERVSPAIPSEGRLIEQPGQSLLFRWFVGLTIASRLCRSCADGLKQPGQNAALRL
jgi:hypothetical protein